MSALVFHTPFILALPELFSLHTILERKATDTFSAARERFPGVKVVNNLAAILADDQVELIFVSTINDTHYQYTKVNSSNCATDPSLILCRRTASTLGNTSSARSPSLPPPPKRTSSQRWRNPKTLFSQFVRSRSFDPRTVS